MTEAACHGKICSRTVVKYLQPVEKAIREAGLNLNPISDGKNLKVPIPKPTKEHRDNMVKIANKAAEQARTRVRSVRHDGMKDLKKDLKLGLSSDEIKKLEKSVCNPQHVHAGTQSFRYSRMVS